ncbi:MAG TPA: alcohol dehydrogenase [Stellaceae bacterium]|nr:alcohol dehydrogenase [Stellaceae bacterium]
MRSYQITQFGKPLELRTYDRPVPQGGEVLVKVAGCGVCHSDLHLWSGYYDLGGGKRITLADRGAVLPFTMGHEIVGTISAVGPTVDSSVLGRKGVVFPWIGCGQCDSCRRGMEPMCETPRTIGTRRDGGYSDYVIVPDARYVVPYGDLDPKLAATAACSGLTAYSAVRKLPALDDHDFVVVIGAGGVGLAGVSLLKTMTPAKIVVIDISEAKRKAALEAGASVAIDSGDGQAVSSIKAACTRTPRAVIDFVGMGMTAQMGMDLLGRGGHLIVVGLYGGEIAVSVSSLAMRNITLQGSNVGTLQELCDLIELLRETGLRPIPVQGRPMDAVNSALLEVAQGQTIGRIVLEPSATPEAVGRSSS